MIEEIRGKVLRQEYEYSRHAIDQSVVRRISRTEIEQAMTNAEIIEAYPANKYGPSCLLLGFTEDHTPIHIQCTYPSRPLLKIITVYRPHPSQWVDFRKRRDYEM